MNDNQKESLPADKKISPIALKEDSAAPYPHSVYEKTPPLCYFLPYCPKGQRFRRQMKHRFRKNHCCHDHIFDPCCPPKHKKCCYIDNCWHNPCSHHDNNPCYDWPHHHGPIYKCFYQGYPAGAVKSSYTRPPKND